MIRGSLERTEVHRYPIWVMVLAPILALSLQTRLPLYWSRFSMLDLALVITVYFACNRRNPIAGLLLGAAIGCAQDCLAAGPIGIFGIIKTLIGYMASSLGSRIDVTHPLMRFILVFASYYMQVAIYFLLMRVLLDRPVANQGWLGLLAALLNAALAVFFFNLLDRTRIRD